MYRIDDPTASATLPTPETALTEGYFTEGNPGTGTPATLERASWFNMVQEELRAVVVAAGLMPSKTTYTQVRDAIKILYGSGRLLRTLVYTNVGGTQFVSINGATPTTTGASTYTPLSVMSTVNVEVQGGGGAGAGGTNPSAGNVSLGAPGKSGAYGRSIFTAAQVGAAQSVSVGAGGASASGGTGATGATSSFGALLSSVGGTGGGVLNNQAVPVQNGNGGSTAAPSGANVISAPGVAGTLSQAIAASLGAIFGGSGGGNVFGPPTTQNVGNANGVNATTIGGGGSGVALLPGGGTATGGNGQAGIVIIREYA